MSLFFLFLFSWLAVACCITKAALPVSGRDWKKVSSC